MNLSDEQHDALAEVINIAFARTAASLSELTGQRVLIDVPRVTVAPMQTLAQSLTPLVHGDVATVHQIFSGPVTGDALLLLDYQDAVLLTDLMLQEQVRSQRLNASAREVLTEIGNILLNACLGVFGNLLQVHVSFAVPRLHLDDLAELLGSLMVGAHDLQYALTVQTGFQLQTSAVSGYMVIIMGVASMDQLIQAIDRLG